MTLVPKTAPFWTAALLAFVALVCGFAAEAAARSRQQQAMMAATRLVVRITGPERADAAEAAAAALQDKPFVAEAQAMSQERAAALLAAWGGQPVESATLPEVEIVEIRLAATADLRAGPGAVTRALTQAGFTADVFGAAPADPASDGLTRLLVGAVMAACAAMAVTLASAARNWARANRAPAMLAAEWGAAKRAALRGYGRIAAERAFAGGLLGAIAAPAAAAAAWLQFSPDADLLAAASAISGVQTLALLTAPLAAAAVAALGARLGAADVFQEADTL